MGGVGVGVGPPVRPSYPPIRPSYPPVRPAHPTGTITDFLLYNAAVESILAGELASAEALLGPAGRAVF